MKTTGKLIVAGMLLALFGSSGCKWVPRHEPNVTLQQLGAYGEAVGQRADACTRSAIALVRNGGYARFAPALPFDVTAVGATSGSLTLLRTFPDDSVESMEEFREPLAESIPEPQPAAPQAVDTPRCPSPSLNCPRQRTAYAELPTVSPPSVPVPAPRLLSPFTTNPVQAQMDLFTSSLVLAGGQRVSLLTDLVQTQRDVASLSEAIADPEARFRRAEQIYAAMDARIQHVLGPDGSQVLQRLRPNLDYIRYGGDPNLPPPPPRPARPARRPTSTIPPNSTLPRPDTASLWLPSDTGLVW